MKSPDPGLDPGEINEKDTNPMNRFSLCAVMTASWLILTFIALSHETVAGSPLAQGQGRGGNAAGKRIGVYDSRAVAVAYAGSELFDQKLRSLKAALEKAQAAGNRKRIKKINDELKAQQYRLHLQGFSTYPVDDILAQIKGQRSAIEKKANVGQILSKWDKKSLSQNKSAEIVDVTPQFIDAFKPTRKARENAENIQKHEPMSLVKARIYFKTHPEK